MEQSSDCRLTVVWKIPDMSKLKCILLSIFHLVNAGIQVGNQCNQNGEQRLFSILVVMKKGSGSDLKQVSRQNRVFGRFQ